MNDIQSYRDMIAAKRVAFVPTGITNPGELNKHMRGHQMHCTEFALRAGRSALFLDTGLGKSLCALDWGRKVVEYTNKPVLMLAPLAVAQQHEKEAIKFDIDAKSIRSEEEIGAKRVYITNYDRLDRFDVSRFGGVILDESSIIKSFAGVTTRKLIDVFSKTPFRLACTATPAPNDHTELGTHAEFFGVMRRDEMLPIWFINDTANTGNWRIKGHAVENFWEWVASWARCVSLPSDIGYSDDGFILPDLVVRHHEVAADRFVDRGEEKDGQSRLFRIPDTSATSIHKEKRLTIKDRADMVAGIVSAERNEPWIIWVDTDYEADAIMPLLHDAGIDAVEVRGSDKREAKESSLVQFTEGRIPVILTKPSIAGYGLNWQHCARQCFAGISFSYENYYQAIRRCWRFGQSCPVNVHVVCADTERSMWNVVARKAGDHDAMKKSMVAAMRRSMSARKSRVSYSAQKEGAFPAWLS